MKKIISASLVAILVTLGINSSAVSAGLTLDIESVDLNQIQVEGSRGAALAILKDGSLLLGGGLRGDTLFLYAKDKLQTVGKVSTQSERIRDSKFGPTDVAVLKEDATSADLLISYPQLNQKSQCVRLVLFRYTMSKTNLTIKKRERWFQGNPCVPISAVQQAAGRIEIIDSKSAYLTTGDLGFSKINQVSARGLLGGVFKVSASSVKQISQGHRNPQGILTIGSALYISEHGPRGGDELNLIVNGKDYGWPFVTLGQPYSSGDYVMPRNTNTHAGYEKPIYSWVPSVAPTELVQLPSSPMWQENQGNIVMGTLVEQVLIFIELTAPNRVGAVVSHDVGERIRDLDVMPDGRMVATTDSGKVLFISGR
jgi:glucose/arabinose dehydrogenase